MSPKDYQVITIQGESKVFKPTVKGKHKTASEYLRENHGTLSLPSDPAPNNLPLQGGMVSSQPSLELSSSRGVWKSRKWKKGREMEQQKKRWESRKLPAKKKLLLMKEMMIIVSSLGDFIAKPLYKITKIT